MNKTIGSAVDKAGADQSSIAATEHGFVPQLFEQLKVSVIAAVVLTLIVCGFYPAVVWGLAQALFHHQANGSLIGRDGRPVTDDKDAIGSALLGQAFGDVKYFHPRPSAAGNGYDATASGGTNLGPTSAKLMFGTTKNFAYTVFAADKSHSALPPIEHRVQGKVLQVTKTTISLAPASAQTPRQTYPLDAAVADPNPAASYHGRTVHAATIAAGTLVELKLNDKNPPAVVAINAADQEIDGGIKSVDTTANKITLGDAAATVINVDPKTTMFIVNGIADAKLDAITTDMTLHALVAVQMDYDGIADRVIHYCQDNKIDYKSSVADSAFIDADGIDDQKLVAAFNAAASPLITPDPSKAIPADAVTSSASGLDPHISTANARLQAQRVADARKLSVEAVQGMISRYTEGPDLGFLGDAGVNVLRLNLALDLAAPAAPSTQPTTAP